ncbi:MAG TPA: hypothetical protein VLW52_04960 [Opitutaceae bacterium]|nr:hypothetical protein [Opitutaceae bacterium]
MKWWRIAAWLVFARFTGRVVSWLLAGLAGRQLRLDPRLTAILANPTSYLLFVLLLYGQLEPGEPVDRATAVFGAAVLLVYPGIDCLWTPWKARTSRPANVALEPEKDSLLAHAIL